ncbi:type II toxin-antitoxin system ParD family antitoxin [Salinarimonas sp.]|uniref:type II toxin-antitoxin system ParD family antitoxin n=1 Tax=Salinarimonas sp. TaxID=2766526 RepID=UPI0032D8E080
MPTEMELEPRLEEIVAQLVRSGRYQTKSDVLREGIRLVQEQEAKLATLDAAIARGLAEADSGNTLPAADVFAELRAKYGSSDT